MRQGNTERFDVVKALTALVISLARQALSIASMQVTGDDFLHARADDVLAGDHAQSITIQSTTGSGRSQHGLGMGEILCRSLPSSTGLTHALNPVKTAHSIHYRAAPLIRAEATRFILEWWLSRQVPSRVSLAGGAADC